MKKVKPLKPASLPAFGRSPIEVAAYNEYVAQRLRLKGTQKCGGGRRIVRKKIQGE